LLTELASTDNAPLLYQLANLL